MSSLQNARIDSTREGKSSGLKLGLALAGVALFTFAVLFVATGALITWQVAGIATVGIAVFVMLSFSLASTQTGVLRNRNVVFALWAIMIGSEEVFSYLTEDVSAGFSSGAYSEAMIWVFVSAAFLIYTIRYPQYLRRVFSGSFKWVSIFA